MSGFQIPGLGQAKPNEILPPLPQDLAVAAASAAEDNEMLDANPPPTDTNGESAKIVIPEQSEESKNSDSMAIDQPENPLSLTHALEAAIGGLGDVNTEQQDAPEPQEEVPLQPDQSENPEWELDSSPYESSSESSSSDSSSDEDSDNEGYELLGVEETARLLMETEGGSDDEGDRGGKASGSGYMRTKNELLEEVIPKPNVTITPEMKIEELGAIEHIVENIMLIKAFTPGEYQVLDTGSVLCNADRVVIGVIAETIGKVLQPMYTVMFNTEDEIKEFGLEVGTKIFYPVDHASFVFTEPLKNVKGSDASNLHDEEVGDEEIEFSDDEKEAEYKRSLKQKKKEKWKSGKDGKEAKEPHPLRQETSADGGLNYDEDDDGPYKPLARPAGFGSGPVSTENYEPNTRSGFQRGRGRDFKGRGSRGRGSGRGGRGGGFGGPRDGYSLPPQGNNNQYSQQPAAPPAGSWNPPPPTAGTVPSLPNFGFPLPGWPQAPAPAQGQAAPVVPPPPGWPGQAQGQQQAPPSGAFVNPAFFAALMSQIQAQGGQGAWGQQPPPPPPPSGGH